MERMYMIVAAMRQGLGICQTYADLDEAVGE